MKSGKHMFVKYTYREIQPVKLFVLTVSPSLLYPCHCLLLNFWHILFKEQRNGNVITYIDFRHNSFRVDVSRRYSMPKNNTRSTCQDKGFQ